MREAGGGQVVGDQDQRQVAPLTHQLSQGPQDVPARDRVEARRDLVAEQHAGAGQQGAGERGTLEFAPGQPIGPAPHQILRQTEAGQDAQRLPPSLIGVEPAQTYGGAGHLLHHRPMCVERGVRVLEHVLHGRQLRTGASAHAAGQHRLAETHLAVVIAVQSGETPREGRLAAAGPADHRQTLPGAQTERGNTQHDRGGPGSGPVPCHQAAHPHHRTP